MCALCWCDNSKSSYYQNGICYETSESMKDFWSKYPVLTQKGRNQNNRRSTAISNLLQLTLRGSWYGSSLYRIGKTKPDASSMVACSISSKVSSSGSENFSVETTLSTQFTIQPKKIAEYAIYNKPTKIILLGCSFQAGLSDTLKSSVISQLGGYFGSALATADVNKDTFEDLLVGVPMFAPKNASGVDEGRVFVYLGSSLLGQFQLLKSLLKGSDAPRARFGAAITPF
ncbi:hypothetical protein CHS0354_043087 [Potamilus streckersoni]|uniref:Uncharacterized protein n=1 Tax=Potamilus streckersoni TaxID=2493646 RepID=A0AAE0SDS6_9BIVA|nr:hypothetical protein CHS0354_043087 [Potamilus streckersoni]